MAKEILLKSAFQNLLLSLSFKFKLKPMNSHLISRIMLSVSSTPGASLAKIKALRVKDQNDLEMIFRCIVEKSESFVIVCKVFLLHCHWRFVMRMCFLVRMEN